MLYTLAFITTILAACSHAPEENDYLFTDASRKNASVYDDSIFIIKKWTAGIKRDSSFVQMIADFTIHDIEYTSTFDALSKEHDKIYYLKLNNKHFGYKGKLRKTGVEPQSRRRNSEFHLQTRQTQNIGSFLELPYKG